MKEDALARIRALKDGHRALLARREEVGWLIRQEHAVHDRLKRQRRAVVLVEGAPRQLGRGRRGAVGHGRRGERSQARERRGGVRSRASHRLRKPVPLGFGLREGKARRQTEAAFDDGLVEEPAASLGEQLQANTLAARRLAEDSDVVLVPAERGDVRLDPLHRGLLIQKAVVSGRVRRILGREGAVPEKSEGADPVVHRHDHDVSLRDQVIPVVGRGAAAAEDERAAEDPDHDRDRRRGCRVRRPHIQRQAVFVACLGVRHRRRVDLRTDGSESRRLERRRPGRCRLRRLPSVAPARGRREGDAEEGSHAPRRHTVDHSLVGRDVEATGHRCVGRTAVRDRIRRVRGRRRLRAARAKPEKRGQRRERTTSSFHRSPT